MVVVDPKAVFPNAGVVVALPNADVVLDGVPKADGVVVVLEGVPNTDAGVALLAGVPNAEVVAGVLKADGVVFDGALNTELVEPPNAGVPNADVVVVAGAGAPKAEGVVEGFPRADVPEVDVLPNAELFRGGATRDDFLASL